MLLVTADEKAKPEVEVDKFMRSIKVFLATSLLLMLTCAGYAMTTVEGSGGQTRGTPGHNAELSGPVFVVATPGTITNVAGEGTDGFWIEKDDGTMVKNFENFKAANGFRLAAGKYRVRPNLRENPKADRAWVKVTVSSP